MTKKHLALIAVVAVAVVFGGLAILPRSGVTKANFDRIKAGTTRNEVEEVFGEKATNSFDADAGRIQIGNWEASDGSIAVIQFVDDRTIHSVWVNNDDTFSDRILRLLRLKDARPPPARRT